MRRPLLLLFLLLSGMAGAQSSSANPVLSRYSIGSSGCTILLPAQPDPVGREYSPDSSLVYTIEAVDSSQNVYYHFGAIVVQLKEGMDDAEEAENMMISYMDYLKTAFDIVSAEEYSKGQTLSSNPNITGVLCYWTDHDGDKWKVIGWSAPGNYLVVQFVYGPQNYPSSTVLDSFFSGMKIPGN